MVCGWGVQVLIFIAYIGLEDEWLRAQGSRFHNPKAARTHILRLWGPKTILCKAFGLF